MNMMCDEIRPRVGCVPSRLMLMMACSSLGSACQPLPALPEGGELAIGALTQGQGAALAAQQWPTDGEPLPNWATEEELEILREANARGLIAVRAASQPPAGDFRVPAEYEPTQAVLLTWAGYTSALGEIAAHVASSAAEVWVVGGPNSINGVPASLYRRLGFSYNTVWTRDYGPIGINEGSQELGIIDTTYRHYASRQADDAIPCQLAGTANAECYTTALILDGGNFMSDGTGNVFMTRRTYEWNTSMSEQQVDQNLRDYFGASTIHVFDYATSGSKPADGTGHIDMFVKLLDECKVLIAETDQAPYKEPLQAAADYFSGLECGSDGETYQVFRIPGWASDETWYTYTNSLIVNDTVIVPSYSGADNEGAREIYQGALPGYTVALVNTDASITSGGSVHCVTKEIPAVTAMENRPPVANAGYDQQSQGGDAVTLDGSQSTDPDGDPITFTWVQLEGPPVTLDLTDPVSPQFATPSVEQDASFTFGLVVNDGQLDSPEDTVEVVVFAAPRQPAGGGTTDGQPGAPNDAESADADADERPFGAEPGCGCAGPGGGGGMVGALPLIASWVRRRVRRRKARKKAPQ